MSNLKSRVRISGDEEERNPELNNTSDVGRFVPPK